MNKYGRVPIKLNFPKQMVWQIYPTGHSLLTPELLGCWTLHQSVSRSLLTGNGQLPRGQFSLHHMSLILCGVLELSCKGSHEPIIYSFPIGKYWPRWEYCTMENRKSTNQGFCHLQCDSWLLTITSTSHQAWALAHAVNHLQGCFNICQFYFVM